MFLGYFVAFAQSIITVGGVLSRLKAGGIGGDFSQTQTPCTWLLSLGLPHVQYLTNSLVFWRLVQLINDGRIGHTFVQYFFCRQIVFIFSMYFIFAWQT